jgi:hypothetical protein
MPKKEIVSILCGSGSGLGHEKRTWKKERSTDWFDHIVLETFDDDQWIENFRMKREAFASLCRDMEASLAPKKFGVHEYTCIVNPSRPPYINVSKMYLLSQTPCMISE